METQTVYFSISKRDLEDLNKSERINVLGVRSDERVYLDKFETFEKDKITRKYVAPIGGTILILLSIAVYIYRRFYYRFDY